MKPEVFIPVIRITNPFNPREFVREALVWHPKKTLAEYFPLPAQPLAIAVNGRVIDEEDWGRIYLGPEDNLVLCPIPRDSGDDDKGVLRTIALIAVAVVAPYAAAGMLGYGMTSAGVAAMGVGGMALAAGLSVAGGMLVNSLLPIKPAQKEQSALNSLAASPSYGVDGPKNISLEGVAVPVCLGTFRMGGNLINAYVENVGATQDLYLLYNAGEGPVANISDIEINGQPIANYTNVEWQTRMGYLSQTLIPWFADTITPHTIGLKLGSDWTNYTTESVVDKLRLDFYAPQGLAGTNVSNGSTYAVTVDLEVQYRRQGESEWTTLAGDEYFTYTNSAVYYEKVFDPDTGTWVLTGGEIEQELMTPGDYQSGTNIMRPDETFGAVQVGYIKTPATAASAVRMSDAARSTVRRSFLTPQLASGVYEVRVRRATPDSADPLVSDDVYLGDINEIVLDDIAYNHTALVGIKIRLTDQLNGLPKVTYLNHGVQVRVWNSTLQCFQQIASSNPAWLALEILTNKRWGGAMADARIDMDVVKAWAAECAAKGLTFDGVIDQSMTIWDALQYVCRAGRAQIVNVGTRWSFVMEREDTPVMMFSVANMIEGSFKEAWLPIAERANQIEVTYFDKNDGYKSRTVRAYDPAAVTAGRPARDASITLYGIVESERAYKEGWLQLNLNRYILQTVEFAAPIEAIGCTVGDLVYVQHDMPQWGYAGRFEAGSSATTMKLDRPMTVAAGKQYKLLALFDAIERGSGTILSVAGTTLVLSAAYDAGRVKRIQVGALDVEVVSTFDSGGQMGVVVASAAGMSVGAAYTLWDTDVIVERDVVNTENTTQTVTLQSPMPAAPAQFSQWMFGETGKVKKPFRVKLISGSGDYRRDLTCVEYNASVYGDPLEAAPTPNYSALSSAIDQVTIDSVAEELYRQGSTIGVRATVFFHSEQEIFRRGIVYLSRNGGPFAEVGSDANRVTIETADGEALEFKVVAVSDTGNVAPFGSAPSIAHTVVGKSAPPADVTGFAVVDGPTGLTISWNANTEVDLAGYDIEQGSVWWDWRGGEAPGATTKVAFGYSGTSFHKPPVVPGTYTFRIKAVDTGGRSSQNEAVASITIAALPAPVMTSAGAIGGSTVTAANAPISNPALKGMRVWVSVTTPVSTSGDPTWEGNAFTATVHGLTYGTTYYALAKFVDWLGASGPASAEFQPALKQAATVDIAANAVTSTRVADNDGLKNIEITINGSGQIGGIGTGVNTVVANTQITINGSGKITGIGAGANTYVDNARITINANGTLSGAGAGQVTITGLGYTGSLNATTNTYYNQAIDPGGINGDSWYDTSTTTFKIKVGGAWLPVGDLTSGKTAAAIAGQGAFATLSQITNANVATYIAAGTIMADRLVANTITAAQIAANTITADRLSISSLSAISANLGTITGGTITGATIRTAASGQRVEMGATHLGSYNSSGGEIGGFGLGGGFNPAAVVSGSAAAGQLALYGRADGYSAYGLLLKQGTEVSAGVFDASGTGGHMRLYPVQADPGFGQVGDISFVGTALKFHDGSSWQTVSTSAASGVSSFNTRTGAVTLTSGDVTAALGFTPENSATSHVNSFNSRTGAVTLSSGDVTGALGFTPENSATSHVNTFNSRTGAVSLASGDVTVALGYTPYNSSNPSGYITGSGNTTGSAGSLSNGSTFYAVNDPIATGRAGWEVRGPSGTTLSSLSFMSNAGTLYGSLMFGANGSAGLYNASGYVANLTINALTVSSSALVANLNADMLDGSHASAFATSGHNHSGVYEPVIAAGAASQFWKGNKTWAALASGDVTGALGYTPYNSSNPSGYITSVGAPVQSVAGKTGAVSLTAADIGGTAWTQSSLTNLNQLTNGPGYITASGSVAYLGGLTRSQMWNNNGNGHATYQSFAAIPDFGVWFMQNSSVADGPGQATQYYTWSHGLGNEYPYSQYAMQVAIPRTPIAGVPYLSVRFKENSAWQSWQKIYAGYADNAAQLSGYSAGNGSGNIPISNGTICANLYAQYANHLSQGSAGAIPYQAGLSSTAWLSGGTAGYLLQTNGSSAPSWVNPASLSVTYAANSSKLYSTDAQYAYGSGNPYYGYLTYDGTRWLFQVSPATPAAVRVAYADAAGSSTYLQGYAPSTSASGSTVALRDGSGDLTTRYFLGNYINTSDDASSGSGLTYLMGKCGDNYHRSISGADVRNWLKPYLNLSIVGGAWSRKENYTSDSNYWTGAVGRDAWDMNSVTSASGLWRYGSCFFDVWSGSNFPSGTSHVHGFQAMHYSNNANGNAYGMRIAGQYSQPGTIFTQTVNAGASSAWYQIWTSNTLTNLSQLTNGPGFITSSGSAAQVAGYSPGNGSGNIPISNGTICTNLYAQYTNHIAQGSAGCIPYQSGISSTAWLSGGTAGYLLQTNGSSAPSWVNPGSLSVSYASTAGNVAASGITGQTGMWTSAARPGPYRLYRRDNDSDYSIQASWSADVSGYWSLRGYSGDTFHAHCYVYYSSYASSAGSSTYATYAYNLTGTPSITVANLYASWGSVSGNFDINGSNGAYIPNGGIACGGVGFLGSGKINVSSAGGIYKAGTAYTNPDYVFEHAFTGQIVKFAAKPGAGAYMGLMSLPELREFVRREWHLPGFGQNAQNDLFSGSEKLLAAVEEGYLYLFDHDDRISALERKCYELSIAREAARHQQRVSINLN